MDVNEDCPSATTAVVKLNVGGRLFETTTRTLSSAGPSSFLSSLPASPTPAFHDRDPDLFSAFLSLLRTGHLPSSALIRFSKIDLSSEALYYGLSQLLFSALRPPPLSGVHCSLSSTLLPSSDPIPSTLSPSSDGSLLLAHSGQISSYDPSLALVSTLRTHVDLITSLRRPSPQLAALGSSSSPGLHVYSILPPYPHHVSAVHWSDPSDPRVYKARVSAIAADLSSPTIFAAFECPHRENAILSIDKHTLAISSIFGRQSGAAIKTATPMKLVNFDNGELLFASTVSMGAFGYSGYMRLWDPRAGKVAWQTTEPGAGRSSRFGDSFADVDVDVENRMIYKVCWKSGDVGVADVRMLGEDPWKYLEEKSVVGSGGVATGGEESVVCCYNGEVFVGREGKGLEVWAKADCGKDGKVWRRCFVDREEDEKRGAIRMMVAGGERLFICREGTAGVEVWESSDRSGAIDVS